MHYYRYCLHHQHKWLFSNVIQTTWFLAALFFVKDDCESKNMFSQWGVQCWYSQASVEISSQHSLKYLGVSINVCEMVSWFISRGCCCKSVAQKTTFQIIACEHVSEMWKLLLIFPLSWWALGLGVFLNWPNIWMKDRMILTGSKIFAKMFLWFKTDFGFFRLFFRPSSYPANGWSWHKKKMYNHVEFWWENGIGSSGLFEEDLAAGIPLERRCYNLHEFPKMT